ncbi:DExH-box splicing factor binding site-domain-containing protein [Lentinula raphanica]|uniref:DExH-box splicing factor binding site-domain-containing protein n=1 Tax=Lentinula raphanica TaxID=153919 RepID=A0AA38PIH7_9AGAR|nr:DExH-box splicing factor binding site-domain-containing protein [Lentinula raphanica]KAJ3843543.1 DExH-box splicing factor binding site-domain-containing protein [Lentinula raphanica]
MSAPKVSFTIRRPSPTSRATSSGPESDSGSSFKIPALPRHLTNDSSAPGSPLARSRTSSPYHENSDSDQDDEVQDELVTSFDAFGVKRLHEKKPQGPLIIPALKNRDWREAARKRRTLSQYVPESARAQTIGSDGSVGGLGTRDTINSGPVVSGLQYGKKDVAIVKQEEDVVMVEPGQTPEHEISKQEEEDSEDKAALRALLAGADGEESGPRIDIIPTPVSEKDAYKQDVEELPESSTLADYERVPVSQFGAAMLRGMGWKEGTAASRKGNGIVQPYIPESRPALLGIGAKEMEVFDDGSNKSAGKRRADKRYIPIVRKDKDGNIVSEDEFRRRNAEKEKRRNRSRSPQRDSRASSRRSSPDRRSYDDRRRDYIQKDKGAGEGRDDRRDKYWARDGDHRDNNRRDRSEQERDYRRDYSRESDRRRH